VRPRPAATPGLTATLTVFGGRTTRLVIHANLQARVNHRPADCQILPCDHFFRRGAGHREQPRRHAAIRA
jgi:hypothetical protein